MQVVIDGLVYEMQAWGGISRLYNEILPRMCNLDASLQITLLTAGRCKQALPVHARIRHRALIPVDRIFRPWRVWWPYYPALRACVQRLVVRDTRERIWHSTFYTIPSRWAGPIVVTVYDMIFERFAHWFNRPADEQARRWKQRCISAADAVLCISETTGMEVQRFYDLDPRMLHVVPLGYSPSFRLLDADDQRLPLPTGKPFLLYVGDREAPYKNFGTLLQAYSQWPGGRYVDLVIVGRAWSKGEVRKLAGLHVADCVHLLTDIDDQELCRLYNAASAFVHPSLYEGFGIPLLEAMACACPIVASHIPSTLEVAQECPIYFDPGSVDDLVAAIDNALSEGRDSERVQRGFKRLADYSWSKTAKQTLEVYRALSTTLPHNQ